MVGIVEFGCYIDLILIIVVNDYQMFWKYVVLGFLIFLLGLFGQIGEGVYVVVILFEMFYDVVEFIQKVVGYFESNFILDFDVGILKQFYVEMLYKVLDMFL